MTQDGLKGREILVAGGGMIGAASALMLQQAGASVVLVDPGDERARASFGNAGQLCTDHCEPPVSFANVLAAPKKLFGAGGPLDFRLEDADLLAPWVGRYLLACLPGTFRRTTEAMAGLQTRTIPAWKALLDAAGRPDLLEDTGYFSLWESEPALEIGVAALKRANIGPARLREPTAHELERLKDTFNGKPRGGVYFEGSGKLADPGATLAALYAAFEAAGGTVRAGRVERLAWPGGKAAATLEGGELLKADLALVAAGARSGELMRGTGLRAPVIAERGYHLHYPQHHWPQDIAPILFQDRWVFASRFTSGARLTGFTELARPDTPPDPKKWETLRRHARELGAPVEGEGIEWMGCRPTLPDFSPAIGRHPAKPLLYAFGHQHVGITLAAATAEAVRELASGAAIPARLRAFDLRRFV